jgi:SsrA-binding protein
MIVNRKLKFDYNILDTWEAGIALLGTEVKSIRLGMGNITNSYAIVEEGEVYLLNMNIPKYKYSAMFNHDEFRRRKLLLNAKEIKKMIKAKEKHHTLIPAKVYFNKRGYLKVTIALCEGKKQYDKRRAIKEREIKRLQRL